jgi:hypothetical protein
MGGVDANHIVALVIDVKDLGEDILIIDGREVITGDMLYWSADMGVGHLCAVGELIATEVCVKVDRHRALSIKLVHATFEALLFDHLLQAFLIHYSQLHI